MPALLGHVIGTNEALIIDDRDRSHGLALLGTANSGVHDLLINLLLDDLKNGCGVFFLDAAGDALPALLKRGDLSRLGHALLLDPEDETQSFGIHLLACRDIADLGARTDTYHRAYAVFRKLWEHEWEERPWRQLLIEHILHVFLENPDYTLAEVPLFLTNARFREHVLSAVTHHPASVDFWQEQFSAEKAAAELIRIQTLLADPTVQQIVGQKQTTIDFSAVMNNSQVLLIKLSPCLPADVKTFLAWMVTSVTSRSRSVAVCHARGSDDGRCHPRPRRPSCSPPRPQGRQPAKASCHRPGGTLDHHTGGMRQLQPSAASHCCAILQLAEPWTSKAERAITITGTGDHLRPEWPITITGIRTGNVIQASSRLDTVSHCPVDKSVNNPVEPACRPRVQRPSGESPGPEARHAKDRFT